MGLFFKNLLGPKSNPLSPHPRSNRLLSKQAVLALAAFQSPPLNSFSVIAVSDDYVPHSALASEGPGRNYAIT